MAGVVKNPITPYKRTLHLLSVDKRDIFLLLIYTVFAALLSLAVPLAAQALVNTIAAGVFLQPLVVLTTLLFIGMLIAGGLKTAQFYIVEILQQRVFARVALQLAAMLPLIQYQALVSEYPPELLNRFFDVIKVQKTMAKLLLDAPAALLQIFASLTLMAIYSPLLLAFDVLIILFIGFIAFVLGKNGVESSIRESEEKYRVAGWLEDVARCQVSLKVDGAGDSLFEMADKQVLEYLSARRSHFSILYRQVIANYFFQAFASAAILGIGGWLVIHEQLTLGQLVASEIVLLMLLAAMDKLVTMFQDWYDLLTAVEKIGHITDLPIERLEGKPLPYCEQGVGVVCQSVSYAYQFNRPLLQNINLVIKPGEFVSLVGESGTGKSTLAGMFCGLLEPHNGQIQINGVDILQVNLEDLRNTVAIVNETNEIFNGTLEENLVVGRKSVTEESLKWAIEVTQLSQEIVNMPLGLKTPVQSAGLNLSRGQIQRIMIARAIAERPKLLILDEAFTGIDERSKFLILDALLNKTNAWTILDISHDGEIVMRSSRVLMLHSGHIVETGSPRELALKSNSYFSQLFPDVAYRCKAGF